VTKTTIEFEDAVVGNLYFCTKRAGSKAVAGSDGILCLIEKTTTSKEHKRAAIKYNKVMHFSYRKDMHFSYRKDMYWFYKIATNDFGYRTSIDAEIGLCLREV